MLKSRDMGQLRADVAANCRAFLALCRRRGPAHFGHGNRAGQGIPGKPVCQGPHSAGAIVTNQKIPSFHWDRAGLAFDVAKNVKGHEYDDARLFPALRRDREKGGLYVGAASGKACPDAPHFQWDDHGKCTAAMVRAGACRG